MLGEQKNIRITEQEREIYEWLKKRGCGMRTIWTRGLLMSEQIEKDKEKREGV